MLKNLRKARAWRHHRRGNGYRFLCQRRYGNSEFCQICKDAESGCLDTAIAFFLGNSLMFCFGAFSGVYVGGNDIFEVMIALNLTVFAIIVLGLNIWTTNDNALYSAGLGLSNITKIKKSPLVLISGALEPWPPFGFTITLRAG